MNVLIACEFSGVVRDAFIARGHSAVSCDFLPTEAPGPHYQGDVRDLLVAGWWDLLIAHPDCTYLTCSAEWAYSDGPYHQKVKSETLVGAARRAAREDALGFVEVLFAAPIRHKAIENPAVGAINSRLRKPDQIIHPNQFGHDASKGTGLWLENLPPLVPTCHVAPRLVCKVCGATQVLYEPFGDSCSLCGGGTLRRWANQTDSGQNRVSPSPDRWKERAKTYQGWADAMADQWGAYITLRGARL